MRRCRALITSLRPARCVSKPLILASAFLTGCDADPAAPNASLGPRVEMCEVTGSPRIINPRASEVAALRQRGNYVTQLYVSPTVLLAVPSGVEQYELPSEAAVTAIVTNNLVADHLRRPVGAGLRLSAIGIGAPNVKGLVRATLRDNVLINNTFGIIVEAGFPVAGSLLRGDIQAEIGGNEIAGSCQAPLLISFSRHTTGLGLNNLPYLENSTYTITNDAPFGDPVPWDGQAWYAHTGGRGNTLAVNGTTVAPGTRAAYDPTGCPQFGSARFAQAIADAAPRR